MSREVCYVLNDENYNGFEAYAKDAEDLEKEVIYYYGLDADEIFHDLSLEFTKEGMYVIAGEGFGCASTMLLEDANKMEVENCPFIYKLEDGKIEIEDKTFSWLDDETIEAIENYYFELGIETVLESENEESEDIDNE